MISAVRTSFNGVRTAGLTFAGVTSQVVLAGGVTNFPSQAGNSGKFLTTDGTVTSWATVSGGGSGTVTSFSAGDLTPLFTTTETNPTSTPALTFSAISQSKNLLFAGPASGANAAPAFRSFVAADIPADISLTFQDLTLTGQLSSDNSNLYSDGAGNLKAVSLNATTVSANVVGNVTGNVSGSAGSVAASTITGTTLAANVVSSSITTLGGGITISAGVVSGVATPSSSTDAANKAYVDNLIAGLKWKTSVRVATTTAGTLATSFENGDTVDGVTLVTGDRILIKNQSAGAENGIYTVNASGAPTRATDADTGSELVSATVAVEQGTTNADKLFTCTNNSITLGSTSVTFVSFASTIVGALLATNNLSDLANSNTARNNLGLGVADSPTFTNLTVLSLSSDGGAILSDGFGNLAVSTVTGNLIGNADTATVSGTCSGNAATATTASNVAVADTTDTTCWVALLQSQTGNQPVYSDGGLIYNASTGNLQGMILTATGSFRPSANDGASLGVSGTAISDAFFATGAVLDFGAGNATLTHSSGVLTSSARIVTTSTAGGSSTPQIYLNCGSSGNPSIKWDAQGGLTGVRFYSGSTEIARFQDNGACYFGSIFTLNDFRFFDYGFSRGANGGKLTIRFGDGPTFDYTAVDAATTAFCQYTCPTASVPVMILKGAASRTVPVLALQNSAGASLGKVGGKIFNSQADAGNVTATGETDLYSYTTVANSFVADGDGVRARFGGVFANALTATVRLRVYFAGTKVYDSGAMTLAALSDWTVDVLGQRVSSSVLRFTTNLSGLLGATGVTYSDYVEVTGLTLTSTNILKITGESDGTGEANNDIVAKLGSVELLAAA